MKKKLISLSLLIGSLMLTSCGPSQIELDVSFLNKHEAALAYLGPETKIFRKATNYYDLSLNEYPDKTNRFLGVLIDADNKRNELTNELLNTLYSYFTSNSYVYIMFYNFKKGLSFFYGTEFMECLGKDKISSDMLSFENNGQDSQFVRYTVADFGDINGKKISGEDFLKMSVGDYSFEVRKILLEE